MICGRSASARRNPARHCVVKRSTFFTSVTDCNIVRAMDDVPQLPQLGDALPLVATGPAWLPAALADLDSVHADHLHCERKAAQSALSLIRSYPERTDLVTAMARLAHDETRHVVQVARLMAERGQPASYDISDDYAARLRTAIRAKE